MSEIDFRLKWDIFLGCEKRVWGVASRYTGGRGLGCPGFKIPTNEYIPYQVAKIVNRVECTLYTLQLTLMYTLYNWYTLHSLDILLCVHIIVLCI